MLRTSYEMTREFHEALELPVADIPGQVPDDRRWLRAVLIAEEVAELLNALTGQPEYRARLFKDGMLRMVEDLFMEVGPADLVELADGCVDSHVVISGTAVEYGIPEDAVYEEVHASNMAKKGGPTRADGKKLKPEGWVAPDVELVLAQAAQKAIAGPGVHIQEPVDLTAYQEMKLNDRYGDPSGGAADRLAGDAYEADAMRRADR